LPGAKTSNGLTLIRNVSKPAEDVRIVRAADVAELQHCWHGCGISATFAAPRTDVA